MIFKLVYSNNKTDCSYFLYDNGFKQYGKYSARANK